MALFFIESLPFLLTTAVWSFESKRGELRSFFPGGVAMVLAFLLHRGADMLSGLIAHLPRFFFIGLFIGSTGFFRLYGDL